MRWRRFGQSILWKARRDLSAAMTPSVMLLGAGGICAAIGLVRNPTGAGGLFGLGGWVVLGLLLALLGFVSSIAIFCYGALGRYRELGYRDRLSTFASNGRQLLTDLIDSEGLDLSLDATIDAWAADVRVLLTEMDSTGIYTQRFDIAAGLPTEDYRLVSDRAGLAPGTLGGDAARSLSFRLVRLMEIMRESER